MEDLLRILKLIFVDNLLVLLLLALSWIPIFFIVKFRSIPLYINMLKSLYIGFKARKAIENSGITNMIKKYQESGEAIQLPQNCDLEISRQIGNLDKELSSLASTDESVLPYSKRVFQEVGESLEANQAYCLVFGSHNDIMKTKTGLLNIAGNPAILDEEKRKILFDILKQGDRSNRIEALYLIEPLINSQDRANQLKQLVDRWSGRTKQELRDINMVQAKLNKKLHWKTDSSQLPAVHEPTDNSFNYVIIDEEADERNSPESSMERFEELFIIQQESEVKQFVADHPYILGLLLEAVVNIKEFFPSPQLCLEILRALDDADDQIGDDQLVLAIYTDLPPIEAQSRLEALDKNWWLNSISKAKGKLCITLDFQ